MGLKSLNNMNYLVFTCVVLILLNIKYCDSSDKPNILIIISDDLGIGDVGCYGNYSIRTPHIDKLAEDGIRLTHHFTAEAVCSPSRAALLVGRYPDRYGFTWRDLGPIVILHVGSNAHLPHSEVTLAEALSAANYSTGLVGKWHLGTECSVFGLRCPGPLNHGFSFHFGILFTLTMEMGGDDPFFILSYPFFDDPFYQGILASIIIVLLTMLLFLKRKFYISLIILVVLAVPTFFCAWFVSTHLKLHKEYFFGASNWFFQNMNEVTVRNGIPEKQTIDFDTIFQQLVNESVQFIERQSNKEDPFFLVHSFLHVHTPMFTNKNNVGRSCCGRYGDNVEEMDDGIGILTQALRDNNIYENTIVYFVSDHGAHLEIIDPEDGQRIGGYNKRFKGGKGMGGQEGGIRVPGIIAWPKTLPANITMDIPTSTMDMMPTLLELAGLPTVHELVPNENELDGRSFAEYLLNETKIPKEDRVFLHYCATLIHSARLSTGGKVFKVHLSTPNWEENSTQCGWGDQYCDCYEAIDISSNALLYELNSDPYEDFPIPPNSREYKRVVPFLKFFVQEWRKNVTSAEPIFSQWGKTIWIPWRQPFCFWNW